MRSPALRTLRYARAWILRSEDFAEDDIVLDRDGTAVPATIVRPARARGPLPAWVIMHGVTRPGRAHQQLVRFSRAVAATGVVVVVPDVPEWRSLDLAPHLSGPTVKAAIQGVRGTGLATDEPVGLVGFSFGAPHAIAAGGMPELRDDIAATVGFGGYSTLETTFDFMMSGCHEWAGEQHVLPVDPYGRWIVGANYLTSVPDHENAGDVADALRELAATAGDEGAPSWHSVYDPVIRRLRDRVDESRQPLFDRFARASHDLLSTAPPADSDQDHALAEGLAAAGRRVDPLIDPLEALGRVERPSFVLHGRRDHLIPFTEAYRLAAALPAKRRDSVTVTRLFGHSAQDPFPFARAPVEVPQLAAALRRVFSVA